MVSEPSPTVGNVRSTDAIPGEIYRLRSRTRIKVEMLHTPPEVRAARRMRVKFLSGVKAGSISDIPSVSIVPLTDSQGSSVEPQWPEEGAPMLVPATGPLRPGATVLVDDDEAGFQWKVKGLLPDGKVEIATTIFESPSVKTVGRDRVQLLRRRRPSLSERPSTETSATRRENSFDQEAWVAENLTPQRPRRRLDAVADSLVLAPRCLCSWRDRFYPGVSLDECADRFRSEIRIRGAIQPDVPGLRIRVPRRFEVILPEEFNVGADSTIDDPAAIVDLRPRSKKRKNRSPAEASRDDERSRRRRRRRKRPRSQ